MCVYAYPYPFKTFVRLQVAWILDEEDRKRRHLLLSLGNDGLILVWELDPEQGALKLMKGFRLLTGSVPVGIRISKAKGNAEIGGEN